MQTYSHFLLTKVMERGLKGRGTAVNGRALLLGSVLPDVPLFLLTIGYGIYRRWFNPALLGESIFGPNYDALYFSDPWWMALHNLFHAPLPLLLLVLVGALAWRKGRSWGTALLWFAAGCGLHSIIDIFTHVHDGPLIFFPLDWTYRFTGPVSYWDPQHGGRIFAPLEHLLDLGIVVWLLWGRWQGRRESGYAT